MRLLYNHGAWKKLSALVETPAIAYSILLAFQIKLYWGVWAAKDITMGDTAHYYIRALQSHTEGTYNLIWSPLYGFFLQLFLYITRDPYIIILGHRMVILLACSFLVLAVLRQVLPKAIALFIAIWWLAMPANYDPLYGVHPFTFAIILIAWLTLAQKSDPRRRVWALVIFTLATLLLRHELALTLLPLGLLILWYDLYRTPKASINPGKHQAALKTHALPLTIGLVVILYFLAHSAFPLSNYLTQIKHKQAFNFGQIYTFVYSKRNTEWKENPWTNYQSIIQRDFGTTDVTVASALWKNPSAMAGHMATNAVLTPGGLQIGLFGIRGTKQNPDYSRSRYKPLKAWLGSTIMLCVLISAAYVIRKDWAAVWRSKIQERAWFWMLLVFSILNGLFICIFVVARPAFIYPFTLAIMTITGLAIYALLKYWNLYSRMRLLVIPLLVFCWLIFPSPWIDPENRPNLTTIRAFMPIKQYFLNPNEKIVLSSYQPNVIAMYVNQNKKFFPISYYTLEKQRPAEKALSSFLIDQEVTTFHINSRSAEMPAVKKFIERSDGHVWKLLSRNTPGEEEWYIYTRSDIAIN